APLLRTKAARLFPYPRANPARQKLRTLLFTVPFRRVSSLPCLRVPPHTAEHPPESQLPHPRSPHQVWHTVDDDDRLMPRLVSLKSLKQPRSILAVHHVNHEDHI